MVIIFDCASGEELLRQDESAGERDSHALPPSAQRRPALALREAERVEPETLPAFLLPGCDGG